MFDTALIIFLATGAFGIIVWGQKLQGKVDAQEKLNDQKQIDLKELVNTRFDAIDTRLDRIERGMNGFLTKD